jgi:hypothetical protein
MFLSCDVGYIYALKDPDTNEIRYIGQSVNPTRRFVEHLNDKSCTYKVNWILKLKKLELTPTIEVLQCCSINNITEQENFWISFYSENGKLTNSANGNDTLPTHKRRELHFKNHGSIGIFQNKDFWVSYYCVNNARHYIGRFSSKVVAAKHYDNVARYYEKYPVTNFPGTIYYSIKKAKEISSKIYKKVNYKSYFSGIHWSEKTKRFRVFISLPNEEKMSYISSFKNFNAALKARDSVAKYYKIPTFKFHTIDPKNIEEIRKENRFKTLDIKTKYSEYRGVSFSAKDNLFTATLILENKRKYIGGFSTDVEAALWHDRVASYYGLPTNNLEDYSISLENVKEKIRESRQKNKYLGVIQLKNKKYAASVMLDRKDYHLGCFDNVKDAVYYADCVRNFYGLPSNNTTKNSLSIEESKLEIGKTKPPKGVRKTGKNYSVRINLDKKEYTVGKIKTLEQAIYISDALRNNYNLPNTYTTTDCLTIEEAKILIKNDGN